MLTRFSLYGFFKNQRYFEPFLVLVFLDRGLSFFEIGLLVGFRELMVNLLEVPTGTVADLYGRRQSMIASFVAYMVSFVVLAFSGSLPLLFGAMALYAAGDAFRTGTHKAIIFSWLRDQGREDERTRVYGYTRSWSKIGSAAGVVVGAIVVLATRSYAATFLLALVPYLANIVNFLGYPDDRDTGRERSLGEVAARLVRVGRSTLRHRPLRRLVAESMGFEGVFHAAKDYLQPLLESSARAWIPTLLAALAVDATLDEAQRTALLVGPVYLVLHLLSGVASRKSHALAEAAGDEEAGARWAWGLALGLYALMLPALALEWYPVAILGFVALHVLQNLWRPVLIGRFDSWTPGEHGATVLSIESQSKSLSTMVVAPLMGLAVEAVQAHGPGGRLWPVAAVGAAVTLAALVLGRSRPEGDLLEVS